MNEPTPSTPPAPSLTDAAGAAAGTGATEPGSGRGASAPAGRPRDPGPRDDQRHDPLPHDQRRARRPDATTPLRRSSSDRVVAGVCGGIAAFTGAPPLAVRVVVLLSLLPSIGVTGVGYLLLWWLLPVAA